MIDEQRDRLLLALARAVEAMLDSETLALIGQAPEQRLSQAGEMAEISGRLRACADLFERERR